MGASAKLGAAFTVRLKEVDAVNAPEDPLMVTITGTPIVAVLPAVSVSTLELVAGLVANDPVTPFGKPDTDRVTLPLNPFAPVTVMVSDALLRCTIVTLDGEGESVKLRAGVIESAMVVDRVNVPEVPVMVTVTGSPTVAVLLAVSVSMLVPDVVELGLKLAVTPPGRPEAASDTLPVNPPMSLIVMVSVLLLPTATDKVDSAAREKSVPAPTSETTWGLPLALSVIVSMPLLIPAAVGAK